MRLKIRECPSIIIIFVMVIDGHSALGFIPGVTMRSFLPTSILFLVACSDYNLAEQKSDPSMPATSTEADGTEPEVNSEDVDTAPTDTAGIIESTEEDTGDEPVDPSECGFIWSGHYANPDVETQSRAIFSNIGDTVFEIHQGDTARYQFAATASSCGDIDLGLVLFQVDDDDDCLHDECWMDEVAMSHLPMNFSNLTDGLAYTPYDLSQQVNDFIYVWNDGLVNGGSPVNGVSGNMTTIHLDAGTTKILEFDFTATSEIPIGSTIRIFFADPIWTDVTTGNDVWDWTPGTSLAVTYTIVE